MFIYSDRKETLGVSDHKIGSATNRVRFKFYLLLAVINIFFQNVA